MAEARILPVKTSPHCSKVLLVVIMSDPLSLPERLSGHKTEEELPL